MHLNVFIYETQSFYRENRLSKGVKYILFTAITGDNVKIRQVSACFFNEFNSITNDDISSLILMKY